MPYKVTKRNRTSCMINAKSRFARKYLKGLTIEAEPGTLGIFTFDNRKNAEEFKRAQNLERLRIIKVKGIGKPRQAPRILGRLTTRSLSLFYKGLDLYTFASPLGTICYPAVEVLE